jgi:7-cyano-7-deazaguanine synthase
MCAISGCVLPAGTSADPVALADACHRAVVTGAVRGNDSFGVVAVSRDGTCRDWHGAQPPRRDDVRAIVGPDVAAVLAVSRATPTTEWRPHQTLADTQPFASADWVVAHNGTVANDAELRAALGVAPASRVDSAVLPHLFQAHGFALGLAEVLGSYALAAVDRRRPHELHLARNFKPLALIRSGSAVHFASTPEQLVDAPPDRVLDLDAPRVVEPPPYSRAVVSATGEVAVAPLEPEPERRRALVIASGGLDSTVAAALVAAGGTQVTLLHFRYGCQAEDSEVRAVRAVADVLGCEVRFLPLDWLKEIGGSPLTTGGDIASAELGAEYPHEWVPARNTVMIAAACAVADADGYTDIVTGTNLEEGGTYPDNTQQFIAAMDTVSQLGTTSRPRVWAPLGTMVKHQVVRTGHQNGAPLDRTWSCYRAGETHCGACGPCFMRRVAFEMAGLDDPMPYAAPLTRLRPV